MNPNTLETTISIIGEALTKARSLDRDRSDVGMLCAEIEVALLSAMDMRELPVIPDDSISRDAGGGIFNANV